MNSKNIVRTYLFRNLFETISYKPILPLKIHRFINTTKNNVIRKIYILHFNRIRIDLDILIISSKIFRGLQPPPIYQATEVVATTKFLPCLPFGWGQFDVLFTLAREITASGRTEWKKRVNDIGERRLCGAAPIVKGFSAGSGTRSFPEMT